MSSATIEHIDHWATTVLPYILEQYKGDTLTDEQKTALGCDTRWQACLKAVIDKLQYIDDASVELPTLLNFESETAPTGKYLDWLAGLVNVTRLTGESDEELYTRAFGTSSDSAGTADFVIAMARYLSGSAEIGDVYFLNEAPATFFVYTPEGSQILRRKVRKIAPGGVNGFPGAAIKFADGSLMGNAKGDIFLAVAKDSDISK